MPNKRETYGLQACSEYTLRTCHIEDPCEYHLMMWLARQKGIRLDKYLRLYRPEIYKRAAPSVINLEDKRNDR